MSPTFLSRLAILALSIAPVVLALPSGSHLERRQNGTNPNLALPGWTFVGCFTDADPATRTLQEHTIVNPGMTPALCTEFCGNFTIPQTFAGTEFTSECFCDFNIQGTATQVDDSECDFPCGGDDTLTCGGASLISVFQNSNPGVLPLPANKAQVGTWAFDGCFTDVVGDNPRTLLERFDIPAGVTIESCTDQCAAAGFNITGLEFGEECWCGSAFSLPTANITAAPTDCSRACEADPTELCGASFRLSVYIDTGVDGGEGTDPTPSPVPTPIPTPTPVPTPVPTPSPVTTDPIA
ncbi:WSC domain-containing protein [Gymnopilus junonius]|uniref:WSC domain-containing protein n=1 Tax=Gymnopilus junonius TaxID=109634 RepID=A0A9P5P0L8_GYMJU|nr:WSC domain-containing protein [Gymnopilus junonius]